MNDRYSLDSDTDYHLLFVKLIEQNIYLKKSDKFALKHIQNILKWE